MAFEVIKLNLIPDGDKPVVHAAQYDIGRPIIIDVYMGEDSYIMTEGITCELQVRKVDGHIVTAEPDSTLGNTITFLTTEQMTACSGTNLCELQFFYGDMTLASLHFFLVVQRDVLYGGLTSASEIHDLEQQITELLPEVLGDEYYTAAQTDALLSDKANISDLSPVATSGSYNDLTDKPTIPAAQVNSDWNAESGVAQILNKPILSTVATSGSYDDLTDKPSIPAAQVQSDWAQSDNTQVDFIKNKPTVPVIETATITNTPIATFTDGADNVPVKSLKVDIDANLSGVSSVNVYRMGENLFDKNASGIIIGKYLKTDGTIGENAQWGISDYIRVVPNSTCVLSGYNNIYPSNLEICFYDDSKNYISGIAQNTFVTSVPNNVSYIRIDFKLVDIDTIHVYNGTTYPISLGETLTQGGVLDVTTGLLTRTDTTTSQLTPTQVKTILGNNNIFADSGNVDEITYFKTGCESIARLIEAYL